MNSNEVLTSPAIAASIAARAVDTGIDTLIPLPVVMLQTTLGRTTIYNFINAGKFPAPVKLGPKRSAWRASEIQAWIAAQQKRSD